MRLRGRLDLLLGENEELHMKVADLKVGQLCDCVCMLIDAHHFTCMCLGGAADVREHIQGQHLNPKS